MSRYHKTSQGTELPLLNLRGRDYLEVKYRLVWFREERPSWSIETGFVSIGDKSACARAVIKNEQGRIVATSHKFETERGFPDFLEKAETGAIGRALALIGYGTQFCADELDEGNRIVDSPVQRREEYSQPQQEAFSEEPVESLADSDGTQRPGLRTELFSLSRANVGDFEVQFGKKYKGRKLREIPRTEIESYVAWLESSAEKKNVPLSYDAKILKKAVELYHSSEEETGSSSAA